MCGFFSVYSFQKKLDYKHLESSANLIRHRGPDQEKNYFNQNFYSKFFRLKILDLSNEAMQPMMDLNKNYLLLFNGEIYNFKELNHSKLNNKIKNKKSDTATLFNLLIKYGDKTLDIIDGMFSFVFFDFKKKNLIFARDRFGIKPLYFHLSDNHLIFCSEIKPILSFLGSKNLNENTMLDFFLKGSLDHNDETFFKEVNSLKPAHFGTLKFNEKKIKIKKYWDLLKNNFEKKSEKKALENLDILFDQSIEKHLISDRKIGLFLSGGTDSTALAHKISKKIKDNFSTYTYGFKDDKEFSEIKKANLTVNKLSIKNYSHEVNSQYIKSNFYNLTNKLESPFTSIRLFGVDALYKYLEKKPTTVILEGDGGDELFGGYDYNFLPHLIDKYKKKNPLEIIKDLSKFSKIKKKTHDLQREYFVNLCLTNSFQFGSTSDGTPFVNVDIFNKDYLNSKIDENFYLKFYKELPNLKNNLKKSQFIDIYFLKLQRALKYKDRISMSYGIESRIPFLDHHFAKYCFNLDNKFKIKNFETRYLFKKLCKKFTKNKISFKKTKFSIADPQTQWLKKELKDFVLDHFKSVNFKNLDYFDTNILTQNFEKFCYNKKTESSFQIFQILSFIVFYNNFFRNRLNV